MRDQREALRRVKDFDADIQRKAAELAQMISKRNEVADRAGLVVGPAPDLHLTELVDPVPGDHISAAAMRSRKASVADTIRALLADREPITKGLTDADIADLVNVALALSADDLVTADRIKACRHR